MSLKVVGGSGQESVTISPFYAQVAVAAQLGPQQRRLRLRRDSEMIIHIHTKGLSQQEKWPGAAGVRETPRSDHLMGHFEYIHSIALDFFKCRRWSTKREHEQGRGGHPTSKSSPRPLYHRPRTLQNGPEPVQAGPLVSSSREPLVIYNSRTNSKSRQHL